MRYRGDSPSRLPVSVTVLLALVCALLVALCPPSYADGRDPAGADPVAVAQSQTPGCGKGAPEDDRGAHPSPPPRGGPSYEPAPVPYDTHGTPGPVGTAAPGVAPHRGPPPLDPPTPVGLSILRV
ncbi:hypothetical protein [Streptomyces sp. NPDC001889]